MTLAIETAVMGVAEVLRDQVAPTLVDDYAIEAVRLSVAMLTMMANAADDAVAQRVCENERLRVLFGEATGLVIDENLALRLDQAARSSDPSLRITDLDRETDRLRRVLVALQIELESRREEASVAMQQRIWRMLLDVEERRAPRM